MTTTTKWSRSGSCYSATISGTFVQISRSLDGRWHVDTQEKSLGNRPTLKVAKALAENALHRQEPEGLTLPILHLNGSGRENLFNQYAAAATAVAEAIAVHARSAPHGRDYYVSQDPGAYEKAHREHTARCEKLGQILAELNQIVEHVS